jgi:hypothetical protein
MFKISKSKIKNETRKKKTRVLPDNCPSDIVNSELYLDEEQQ